MIHPMTYAGLTKESRIAKEYYIHLEEKLFKILSEVVHDTLKVSKNDLIHGTRERYIADARKIVTHIMRDKTHITYQALGKFMGQDHATTIHQNKVAKNLLITEPAFQKKYNLVILAFENQLSKL